MDNQVPIVAIVGRPNVGKSTLFNRLAGHRRALVADRPGLTRDRIAEEVELAGRRLLLVDTAGLDPDAADGLAAAVQSQARAALATADAILFVVDGQAGLLPEDEAIAQTLRRSDKPLVLAVNKIDVPAHRDRTADFHRLGFESVRAVSAEHGPGAFDALEELVVRLPEPTSDPGEPEEGIHLAIVGRPNVGKSLLVNRLAGEERVVVSSVPGTTRDTIDIRIELDGEAFVLLDTAGLRRPGRRDRMGERGGALMTVRSLERAEVALLLVDASEGFTDQDAHVASLLRDRGCAAVVLANKWDLVERDKGTGIREDIAHGLRFMSDVPLLTISAQTGLHVGKLLPLVRKVSQAATRRVPTSDLNRWLKETVAKHEPSLARRGYNRRLIKFFYATQTGVRPPTFVLFCTEPRAIQESYRRFLENRLRESFDFDGTPVRLRLRSRREDSRSGRARR